MNDKEWIKWIKDNTEKPVGMSWKNWIKSFAKFNDRAEFEEEANGIDG